MNALLTRERTATVSSVFHCEDCTGCVTLVAVHSAERDLCTGREYCS